ncbi:histone-lysine N-methyltransferase PRDM9-like [Plodia interpunctella]|uniref:histone-lysine N-methyltransferase PRDM9-like n=1 Tax=Plodia interpunctella TaxID=58824 RepID=UPI002367EB1D|nr:histone-lysine N-methyltransferase PRDM9-like [Plodia interpunctella]
MSRFNLRRKPRISYYEIEEPNLDEYVYCDECTDFVYEYCAIHGPLLVVPDDKVPSRAGVPPWVPRAALTVPRVFLHIAPSVIPGAGLGVFSTLTLPRGVRFGPYQGKHMAAAKSMYCWQIKSADLKHRTVVDAADGETSNWMRYVNCARNWSEQNLVAYQYRGQIYYRTIKIIPRFTELLVFYGSEFANALGIELHYYNSPPRYAQYGASPVKKPKAKTEKLTRSYEPLPVTDENRNVIQKTGIEKVSNNVIEEKSKTIKQFTCDDCGTTLHYKSLFITHIKTHNEKSKNAYFECKSCDYKGATNNSLQRHMQLHNKDRVHECNICQWRFKYNQNLKTHLRLHTGEKPYECNICQRKFNQNWSLKTHLKLHTGEKPYECNICQRKFNQNWLLKRHLRLHTGEKPYECNICQRRFNQNSNLKNHLRIHTR